MIIIRPLIHYEENKHRVKLLRAATEVLEELAKLIKKSNIPYWLLKESDEKIRKIIDEYMRKNT
jgi:hypothetical protein